MNAVIKYSVGLFIFAHITLTVLYLLPANPMTKSYGTLTQRYMNTFFRQDWKLFSPEPALYSLRMLYRCGNKVNPQLTTPWKDPLSQLIKQHQRNRLSFAGKRIYVFHGMYRQLIGRKSSLISKNNCTATDRKCHSQVSKQIIDSREYKHMMKFANTLCVAEGNQGAQSFKVLKSYPVPFSQRNKPNARPVMTIEFDSEKIYAAH